MYAPDLLDHLLAEPLFQLLPGVQTQPPTPEGVKALSEFLKAAISAAQADGWWSTERIQAIATMVSAIAWPATLLTAVLIFRKPIITFLYNVDDVEIVGARLKRLVLQLRIFLLFVMRDSGLCLMTSSPERPGEDEGC